ncbi:hypothetical protein ALC57_09133, partial [Trachymyrmex cornetzi]
RAPHVRRSSRGHQPDQTEPPPPTNTEYLDISYSPVSADNTQPLDLSTLSIPDPAIRDIRAYSPPSIQERFPPSPFLNQLPTPFPLQSGPSQVKWEELFRFYSTASNEADRVVTVYIPGNSTPYKVLYRYLIPCTFLASSSQ